MSKLYTTKVNNLFQFDIDASQLSQLDAIKTSDANYHVLKDNKSYKAEITQSQFHQKKYTIKINNNSYAVDIHNELDELIKDMGFEIGTSKQINEIKAPMPGLILEINVTVGQQVKENDDVLILEAMKMENVLTAPRDGTIKSISVKKGEAVEKSQLLIEFE